MNIPHLHSGQLVIQNLIRHAVAPALFADPDLRILQVNPAMAALGGLSGGPMSGLTPGCLLTDLVPVSDRVALRQAVADTGAQPVPLALGPALIAATLVRIEGEFGRLMGYLVQADTAAPAPSLNWEAALEGAGQGVWDYDLASGRRLYSDAWHELRGLRPDDGAGDDQAEWFDKIHPDDLNLARDYSAKLEAGLLDNVHYEYRERHAQGHWIWIMCRGRSIAWDAAGRPTRYVGTDTDITAIKTAEAAVHQLSNDEIRWRNAQESTEQGLWDLDDESGVKYVSPQWFRMRGLPEDATAEAGHGQWTGRIHPDDIAGVKAAILHQKTWQLDSTKLEYRERHQDGRWIWILSRGRIVRRDADGGSVRTVGTDTDITDIKVSEERIVRISRRLEMAISASKVGVWEFDLTSSRVEWDAVMREMYGLPNDQSPLPRDVWEDALHPEDKAAALNTSQIAMQSNSDYMLDYRIIRRDGTIRHMRSRASHIDDPIDGPKLVGLNWDVTQDYALAQELKDANAVALKRNSQLEAARALMEHNSLHDALTGLPNRRMLDMVQNASIAALGDANRRFAVLHVDLDRFKQINDTLGHDAGDAVLIRTASILRETVGPDDLVARVGGDEFAVFINDAAAEEELVQLARQIIARTAMPMKYQHHDCRCGVSVGIAYAEGREVDGKALFINADMAMYRSKHGGRGGFSVFNDDMKREALAKKSRSDELLAALERDEFFCLYQPQYSSAGLQFTGIEALVRWRNPVNGLMSPADFLPLAEELQIIDRIDAIVLRLALADLADFQRQGLHIPRLSINISDRRLKDPGLAQELLQLDMPHGLLSFEFLESIFLDEPDDVQIININCIRALGIGIEVDDFGSGHSSIVSLLKLKPDRLKIDRTIVEPVTRSKRQRQLVQSIVDIGKLQGIKVLAEGVETADHVRIMQDIGCDELQGYALSRPLSAASLVKLLGRPAPKT